MTDPFAPQVFSIKADKILNAVTTGLKCGCFGTGNSLHFPSNVTWYYYETTMLLPCLNSACAMTWNNPCFWTLEIDIASNARVSEFPPPAVLAPMLSESHTLPCTRRSCFVIFRFMARGQSPITIVSFCSFELILSAGYTYQAIAKLSKFRLSLASRHVMWDRLHWNYIFISNFSYWKARQLASEIVATLSEQNISQASYFENSFFRIKQLTILFAAQKVYWFRVIHCYIVTQSNQSNCNSIILLPSDFANIFITLPSW